ncbi:MAG: hypothetical protein JWR90_2937 [Marmoricola sp.]|nr:hypothetical protein [Marmoricola sp.]
MALQNGAGDVRATGRQALSPGGKYGPKLWYRRRAPLGLVSAYSRRL